MTTSTTSAEKTKVTTVTNPATDAAVREKLITARVTLLIKSPFFGNLATRLKLVNADSWCATAATDGRNFYYNTEFISKMPSKQVEFLMGHEVLHCAYEHILRRGNRDPKIWNIANDYCVNQDLIEYKIGEMILGGLYDRKYIGWSAEEVYDDLVKHAKKININKLFDMLIDEHLEVDSGESEGDDKAALKGKPRLSAAELKEIRDEFKEALLSAAQTVNKEDIPGNVKRAIKDLTDPQLNWREILNQTIQSKFKSDFTWSRPSRKGWGIDAILPGSNVGQAVEVAISLDSSGSISKEMLTDFLSEVRGIMETFDDYVIDIWCIDSQVYNWQRFTPDNIDEFDNYEIMGGGGNTFEENWSFMREHDITPKQFIMFTDGYPCPNWSAPGDEDYCDTVFLLHSTDSIVAPFGTTVYYNT